ncbi:MAG: Xaa-Pro peptidase family protein [Marinovum algicola]
MRAYRLERIRAQLRAEDCAGIVLSNPINVRYATDSVRSTIFNLHTPHRYAFVATDGPVVLFDYKHVANRPDHYGDIPEIVDEVRPAKSWTFFGTGSRQEEKAELWADELADLLRAHGGGNTRLAFDRLDPIGNAAICARQLTVANGQKIMELARAIKSGDEIAGMKIALAVAEAGMAQMQDHLETGITENQLWSHLHKENIARGGEWIETRLLASGQRTNPWSQGSSDRIIRAGDLVAFDTDMVGPNGFLADISRTFFCGPGRPTDTQRHLYTLAHEQIHHDMALLKPGLSFREYSDRSWAIPDEFLHNRYACILHGAGIVDEWPKIPHPLDWEAIGYDGVFEENMVVCCESYIGRENGREGVKLEEQVLIGPDGPILLSQYPFEEALLDA